MGVDLAHHEIYRAKVGKGGKLLGIFMKLDKVVTIYCKF